MALKASLLFSTQGSDGGFTMSSSQIVFICTSGALLFLIFILLLSKYDYVCLLFDSLCAKVCVCLCVWYGHQIKRCFFKMSAARVQLV